MESAANYIALAIPVFFLLIGVELLVAWVQHRRLYNFSDTLANISCGIAQQVLGAFVKTVLAMTYLVIYDRIRIFTLGADQWWVWVFAFIGVDFFYYWFHRYAHEISFMWGGHIVHHQSEEYNLSVALRQGAFQSFTSWVFYLPLAWIGLSPFVFVVINQFVTLYQFWIHTKLIGKMPKWFEFIFNTPSHHRVHHGVNPKYIDKNHGGTLIIWDRMFGTFQEEEEEVVYGITKPLNSWNPVWANFDYILDVLRLMGMCRNPLDMLRVLWKGPGWRPDYLGGPLSVPEVDPARVQRYDTVVPTKLRVYVLIQYVALLGVTTGFLFGADKVLVAIPGWTGWAWLSAMGLLLWTGVATLGGLTEGKAWAKPVEVLRVLASASVLTLYLRQSNPHPNIVFAAGSYVLLTMGLFIFLARENATVKPVLVEP